MLRLRTLIVDDEPLALELLAAECARFGFVEIVGSARDGFSAAAAIELHRPDLVLIDVEMPGLNGIAVAAGARAPATQFIFVTAHPAYAVEAFGLEATDYLLKPVAPDRLAIALERVRRRLRRGSALGEASPAHAEEAAAVLWLKGREGYVQLPHHEVLWLEAERDYVMLHTSRKSYLFRSSLGAMRERLGRDAMLQVHRSAVVRRTAIRQIRPAARGLLTLLLQNGAEIGVGRSYVSAVAQALGVPRGRSAPSAA